MWVYMCVHLCVCMNAGLPRLHCPSGFPYPSEGCHSKALGLAGRELGSLLYWSQSQPLATAHSVHH